MDLTQVDPEDGRPWDLNDKAKIKKLWRLVKDCQPYCIICCPPCTMYCALQALIKKRFSEAAWQTKLEQARKHIAICVEVCRYQRSQKRFFVFEHPEESKSWKLLELEDLRKLEDVYTAEFDMCRFGMTARDRDGVTKPVRKGTRMVTNSWEVARRLTMRCPDRKHGVKPEKRHQHTGLVYGKVRRWVKYTPGNYAGLCVPALKRSRQLNV